MPSRQVSATSAAEPQVACTCLSTNSALLARRVFDVCIVDEASQITLPATIGALLKVRAVGRLLLGFGLPPRH